jgi:hypothetical protein
MSILSPDTLTETILDFFGYCRMLSGYNIKLGYVISFKPLGFLPYTHFNFRFTRCEKLTVLY